MRTSLGCAVERRIGQGLELLLSTVGEIAVVIGGMPRRTSLFGTALWFAIAVICFVLVVLVRGRGRRR